MELKKSALIIRNSDSKDNQTKKIKVQRSNTLHGKEWSTELLINLSSSNIKKLESEEHNLDDQSSFQCPQWSKRNKTRKSNFKDIVSSNKFWLPSPTVTFTKEEIQCQNAEIDKKLGLPFSPVTRAEEREMNEKFKAGLTCDDNNALIQVRIWD